MTDIKLAAHGTSTADRSGDWRDQAVCLGKDPELWFPIGNTGPAILQIETAKAWCRTCPVMSTCLRWALDTGQDAGVWGGLSEDERRALKRRNARERARGFARPQTVREPRGGFVPAEPTREIIAAALAREWTLKAVADAIGVRYQTCADILKRRTESVTGATARKVADADLSGPPPVPAETQTAGRC